MTVWCGGGDGDDALENFPHTPGLPVTVSVTVRVRKESRLRGSTGEYSKQRRDTPAGPNPLLGVDLLVYGVSYCVTAYHMVNTPNELSKQVVVGSNPIARSKVLLKGDASFLPFCSFMMIPKKEQR